MLDLKDQVSLIDSRTVELLGKLDTGESKATWVALKKHIDEAVKAAQASNVEKLLSSLFTMQSLIAVGNRDIETWTEIYEAVNLRKSLAETERRLLMQGDQLMTAEQALLMITGIISIVRTYVTDPDTMLRISNGVERLIIAR